jgi:hypothetical protein
MNYPVIELVLVSASLMVTLACTALIYIIWRRGSERLDQLSSSGALLVKASCHNTKQLRELETSVRHVHDNGLETLAFQKKANDHQRVLLASLNLQTQRIADMLARSGGGTPPARRETVTSQRPAAVAAIAPGATRSRVIGGASDQPVGVVPLETWIARSRNAERPREVARNQPAGTVELMSQRFDRFIDEIGRTAEQAVREQDVSSARPARVAANG